MRVVARRYSGSFSRSGPQPEIRIGLSAIVFLLLCFVISCSNSSSSHPMFSNANLKGNFTYTLSGTSYGSGGGPYQESGTFIADGNGNITDGIDDFIQNSTVSSNPITGSYTVNGNVTMTLNSSRGQVQFAMTILSTSSLYLIEYDSFATGSGVALQQNPAAFSAAPTGTFVFRLHSSVANSAAQGSVSSVGQMILQQGAITGTEDVVRDGVPGATSILGVMTSPDTNGRGTVELNDGAGNESNYIYYVVDSNILKFLETDSGTLGGGRADQQSAGPFSNASLQGGLSFRGRGDTLTSSFGANSLGEFISDGNGNITGGSYDAVQDGNAAANVPLTGSYAVDSTGRAAITLNPQGMSPISLIVWMVNSSSGLLMVNSANLSVVGRIDQQQETSFSAASLKGNFAFYMFGTESQGAPSVNKVGVLTFDGSSQVTFNDYFVDLGGQTARKGPASGTYSVSSDGRVVSFTVGGDHTQILYLISDGSASLIVGTSGSELAGSIAQQTASSGAIPPD